MSTEKNKQKTAQAGVTPAASQAAKKPVRSKKKSARRAAAKPVAKKRAQTKTATKQQAAVAKQKNQTTPETSVATPGGSTPKATAPASAASDSAPRNSLAWVAIATALFAMLVAGYATYQGTLSRQFSDVSIKGLDERIALLVTDQQGLKREFSDLLQQGNAADAQRDASLSAIQQQLGAQQTALEKVQLASQATTDDIKAELGSAVARWKLDEMQSILVRVNQYYQLGGDKIRAAEGLELVRSMLAGINDPRLGTVSDGVAADLLRIQSDKLPDIAEINSRLTALSGLIPQLTLAGEGAKSASGNEGEGVDKSADADADASLLAASRSLLEDIGSMVKYTNREAPLRPSLDSNQRFILYELLQLKLQVAMAALMRGDSEVYQSQLKSAAENVKRYFEPADSVTVSVQQALKSLLDEKVSLEIEPLTAGLSALNRVMILEK